MVLHCHIFIISELVSGTFISRGNERKEEKMKKALPVFSFSFLSEKADGEFCSFHSGHFVLIAYCAHKNRAVLEIIVLFMVRKAISIKGK